MRTNHRILIVDDDIQHIRLMKRALDRSFVTMSVQSGEEAVEAAAVFRPEIVLLDVNMAPIDGYETCRRLRADYRFRWVKILMVSGNVNREERLAGYEAGADDYVTKPFDPGELSAKIHVFLALRRVEEIERLKRSLLALLSTHAQAPSRNIINQVTALIETPGTSKQLRSTLGLLLQSAVDFNRFSEKAAKLHRLQDGLRLRCRTGRLADRLSAIAGRLKNEMTRSELDFLLDCPTDLQLCGDWSVLDDIFGYILENAVQHARKGSIICVSAAPGERNCTIEFKNWGEPIAPDLLKEIFTPFPIKDIMHHHKGHGLSLSIVKTLTQLHNGVIEAESGPDGETVFRLTLPLTMEVK